MAEKGVGREEEDAIHFQENMRDDPLAHPDHLTTCPSSTSKILVQCCMLGFLLLLIFIYNCVYRLHWLRDGKPIRRNQSHILEYPENGTLVFPQFSVREEGYFRCVATNQHGVSLSPVIELRLRGQMVCVCVCVCVLSLIHI